jgi:rRNA processing protein Gar1
MAGLERKERRRRTEMARIAATDNSRAPRVGDRVRAKTTRRIGRIVDVVGRGAATRYAVRYDHEPQDDFLTTPAREGAELPRELIECER